MNLHQLKIFRAVARLRNFTRASEELHLSQPSVSVQLKQLEDHLEVGLVERAGRETVLTDAGRILEGYADRVFAILEEAREALEDLKGLRAGLLAVGASTTPGVYLVPGVMSVYRGRYPEVKLSLSISNTAEIERRIIRNELDIGFIGEELEHPEIIARRIMEDEIFLVAPWGSDLGAGGKTISPKELEGRSFIMREKGSATRRCVEEAFGRAGFGINIMMELETPEAAKQAVVEGLGLSFMSGLAVRGELGEDRLRALRVRGVRITRPLNLIYRKGKRFSRAVEAFLALVEELQINHSAGGHFL